MLGSWRKVVGWFLVFLLLSIVSVLVDAYWYQPTPAPETNPHPPIQGHVALRVPSEIANVYRDTQRQLLQAVDLRRAELRVASQTEPALTIKPLMDKVLVVPKWFPARGV